MESNTTPPRLKPGTVKKKRVSKPPVKKTRVSKEEVKKPRVSKQVPIKPRVSESTVKKTRSSQSRVDSPKESKMLLPTRRRISDLFANPRTRAQVHTAVLMIGVSALLVAELNFGIFAKMPEDLDKALHYIMGRRLAAVVFFLAYLCIAWRVLLSEEGSLTRILIWIPTMLAAALLIAITLALIIAFLKEFIDIGTAGNVEWEDINETLEGAMSMIPLVAIIMALTPIFIPLDILMQIPKLVKTDIRTGVGTLDTYVRALKTQKTRLKPAQVLLVEDDIVCATTVFNFCSNVGIQCHHVSTISEAEKYLFANLKSTRLVLLDNFVRVDPTGDNRTGSDWLPELHAKFPPDKRRFTIVMMSGHTEVIGDNASLADLVLKKPWKPTVLHKFLLKKGIIK